MIISILQGGLGNQMFQYAMAYALSKKCNRTLKLYNGIVSNLDTKRAYELNVFPGIQVGLINHIHDFLFANDRMSSWKKRFFKYTRLVNIVQENGFSYTDIDLPFYAINYVNGYWQSYKYFEDYQDDIRAQFLSVNAWTGVSKSISCNINASCTPISIHIRRGDYLIQHVRDFHGILPLSYYEEAISILEDRYSDITFFVFSDDIEWAKDNIKSNSNMFWCEGNVGRNSYQDMLLMSKCSHHIIANSSFSWWGAWLNPSKLKDVIAPRKWFLNQVANDQISGIVPDSWVRI